VNSTTYDRAQNVATSYDGARSDTARISAEIMERLIELHELRKTSAADLCRRLGTLADLSPTMFLITLRLGSGDVSAVRQSFGEMAATTGRTRQALHYEWRHEIQRVRLVFPALADLMDEYRQSTDHDAAKGGDAEFAP
jgi:xanthine dehydrogenase iron-sulfur cluster and FAD-binding subunit A